MKYYLKCYNAWNYCMPKNGKPLGITNIKKNYIRSLYHFF